MPFNEKYGLVCPVRKANTYMKDEIDISKCTKYKEVKAVIDDWIDYYNNKRYQ